MKYKQVIHIVINPNYCIKNKTQLISWIDGNEKQKILIIVQL